jgi:hypothetical protein
MFLKLTLHLVVMVNKLKEFDDKNPIPFWLYANKKKLEAVDYPLTTDLNL